MKKKLTVIGLCGVACLLIGATITQVIEAQSTVSGWGGCANAYVEFRQELPPIPLPASAEELLERAEKGDWSFMTDKHWYIRQPQTLYVATGSELEKETKSQLPLKLIIMEDIRLGEIILCSVDEEKGTWNPIASFTAPSIVDETDAEYAKLNSEEKSRELFFQLSYRRVIAEITLKPASALTELFARSTPAPTAGGGGMMMRSSTPPPAHTNDLWLFLDAAGSGGTKTLNVFAPESMTNIEVFAIDNLLDDFWSLSATNLNPAGPTNPATVNVSSSSTSQYYRACTWADTDEDGLSSGFEMYVHQTDPLDADTDGDGYSDGSAWPAGYGGVMRGTNDAFALDASAWRDTDGDGLPNEVVGTSTSEPPLVEDFDDDGDGTNEMSMAGIWISAEEISGLATNGAQWTNLLADADRPISVIDISDPDERGDVYSMAKALVYARTSDSLYRSNVIDACSDAIGKEAGGSSLALGRNLGGFIIAADLVDLPQADDMLFRDWLREMLTNSMSDSLSLTTAHESLADNKGTHAGGARAAIAAYLQEWDELDDVATVFKGWAGDRTSHTFTDYGTNDTWQADTNSPVGINPKDAMIGTNSVDGVLPVAMQESGDFAWPPPQGDYAYEALQGALLQAVILDRAGHDVWNWEDKAVMRAYKWMDKKAKYSAQGDDSWQPFLVNHFYDTNLPTQVTSAHGKNIAPTDWTHPDLDLDYFPGDFSGETILTNGLPGDWRPFAAGSPWNTPILEDAMTHSNSAQIITQAIYRTENIRLVNSFLTPIWVVNSSNALPVTTNVVPSTNLIWTHMNNLKTNIYIKFDTNQDGVSDDPIPLASTMYPEPKPDGHICIVDPFKRVAYEMSKYYGWGEGYLWVTNREAQNPPECTTFNIWDLTGTGYGDDPTDLESSDDWQAQGGKASGFCLIGGILRPEELASGEIRHALTFSFGKTREDENGEIMMYPPACRSDGWVTNNPPDEIYPIHGMRFQLDPTLVESNLNEWGLTEDAKVLARALQTYGMYLGDTGGSMAIAVQLLGTNRASNRAEWDNLFPGFYDSVTNIPTSAFRVIGDTNQTVIIK